jgi:hypothetical protein
VQLKKDQGKPVKTLLLALLVSAVFWQPVFAWPRSDLDMVLVEGAQASVFGKS